MNTVPTGLSGVPPSGPAMPLTAMRPGRAGARARAVGHLAAPSAR